MKLSPTVELILNLAAREAIAAEFREIEPEHILLGILKFSELDLQSPGNAFADPEFLKHLKTELNEIQALLRERGLDSTSLRRQIRKESGRGGSPYKGGIIHRSREAKQLFVLSEDMSRQEGAKVITAVHFLRALFKNPPPLVVKILGDVIRTPESKFDGAESIVPAGGNFKERNLSSLARQGRIHSLESRKIQARALARYAGHSRNKPVVLVSLDAKVVRECTETMACELISSHESDDKKNRRLWKIVEISIPRSIDESNHIFEDYLRQIVHKASDREVDVVIITGAIPVDSKNRMHDRIKVLTDEVMAVAHPPCLMVFTLPGVVRKMIEQNETAEVRCHQVLLVSPLPAQVPAELPIPSQEVAVADWMSPFFNAGSWKLKEHLFHSWEKGIDNREEITIQCFLASALELNELGITLSQLLGITKKDLRKALPKLITGHTPVTMTRVPLAQESKELLALAVELARVEPDNVEPGMVDLRHVAGAMALTPKVCSILKVPPASREDVDRMLGDLFVRDLSVMGMGELSHTLKELRSRLLERVFGQDQAIHTFIEGVFNSEVVAAADTDRRQPKAIFVFAGPPGVGKTYLAECGAGALGRPFRRFDMSGYSDHQVGVHLLAGVQRSYQGAHPGQLTEFVEKNPNAVLLFDEIEKAHLNVVQLFLQLLDQGTLEDKYTEQNVYFRDTIIIFTTNAGKQLYDEPNVSGVHPVNVGFHRKTILNALEKEQDPRTGKPFFPQALCSRLATGYPLMFNHLGVNDLEKIAGTEMNRMAAFLEKQYFKEIEFGPVVPMCLVLGEGADTDARTVRSQAESFVKAEMFKLSQLYRTDRFDSILKETDRIIFSIDSMDSIPDEVRTLLEPDEKPKALLVADERLNELWCEHISGIDWKFAADLPDAQNILAAEEIDIVLLDLWIGKKISGEESSAAAMTVCQFDHVPAAASSIREGQEVLRTIHEKYPNIPCFLLSFGKGNKDLSGVDEELFLACMRSGGARGVIETQFLSREPEGWETARDDLNATLNKTAMQIYRERKARELGAQRKTLAFDTAPQVSSRDRSITIRLRNLHLTSAVSADDVSEILQDVERPTIRFPDVYGADSAKEELGYIVKWLKDPRQYKAMGLRPPRGILLYGKPGTGKTMLARALAGECNATFITEAAPNFVTKYVGSGPENIRNLFARARRYAPTILFIDEIDAVGRKRSGGIGSRAQEETLNAILIEMDGFDASASKPVIVLAATNLVEILDAALRRRFDRDIEVDKPDRAARTAYLKRRLQGSKARAVSDGVIERLAGQSANMTIAELERIVELAGRMASSGNGVITDDLVEEAFERMRMGETKGETDPKTLLRVARHEAGHCMIGWMRGEKPVQITIVARGKAGGFVEREADEDKMIYTRTELGGMIRQAMGGRAAEIIYYGENEGFSTGVSGDLRTATHYAELMVRDYGMGEEIGQVTIDPKRLTDGPVAIKVMQSVEKIIKGQLKQAIEELQNSRKSLDLLVDRLMEKNRLTRTELEAILPKVP